MIAVPAGVRVLVATQAGGLPARCRQSRRPGARATPPGSVLGDAVRLPLEAGTARFIMHPLVRFRAVG